MGYQKKHLYIGNILKYVKMNQGCNLKEISNIIIFREISNFRKKFPTSFL
jgi:hypothetical protein